MNIITLHENILDKFNKEQQEDNTNINHINQLLQQPTHFSEETMKKLAKTKQEIDQRKLEKNKFIVKTNNILYQYKELLQIPVEVEKNDANGDIKQELQQNYISIVENILAKKKWYDIKIVSKQNKIICSSCNNDDPQSFEMDDSNKKFCLKCSTQQDNLETITHNNDYDKINIVNKFAYSRIIHFQECLKQYQGKQNYKIPQEVFDQLEEKFKSLNLLNDSPINYIKYSRINKEHILLFLKQLNYSNHYENTNYIYYVFLGKRIDDIDYLEEQLIEDFKELSILYDCIYGKDKPKELLRKNFMNVQYILFQLLRNRNHECQIENFSVLKTIEKKKFHDDICSHLFNQLGWNFTPIF